MPKFLGTIALVFGLVFLVTAVIRLARPELNLFEIVLNGALAVLWLGAGIWLWRFARRKSNRSR